MNLRPILVATFAAFIPATSLAAPPVPSGGSEAAQATTPSAAEPPRAEIRVSAAEREMVLGEMRQMLAHSHAILDAALRDDMPRVARAARAMGLRGGAPMPPELAPRLPTAFKQLAMQTHRTFDEIADDAEKGGSREAVLRRLSQNLGRCVECHAGWALTEQR